MKDFKRNIIFYKKTIREALEQLNSISGTDNLTLFVLNENDQLVGTLTDGDVRRALLKGKTIENELREVMFTKFRFLKRNNYSISEIHKIKKDRINTIPLLDESGKIIKIIDFRMQPSLLPVDAVIMAGGVGERLRPLTEKTPKPLLHVGDKPILEHNVDRLAKYGIDKITISINYLGDQIVNYFGDGSSKEIKIEYVEETTPLGTIGALKLIRSFDHEYILLMNSDLLTNMNFEDFYRQFEEEKADVAIASIPYKVDIPYAVLELSNNNVVNLKEKPSYTYYSNAGIYLIRKETIDHIPYNQHYNATDFIEHLISLGKKVIHYPILEYWLDIGKSEDFKKAQEDIKHLKL